MKKTDTQFSSSQAALEASLGLEALEPRLLLDAAAVATGAEAMDAGEADTRANSARALFAPLDTDKGHNPALAPLPIGPGNPLQDSGVLAPMGAMTPSDFLAPEPGSEGNFEAGGGIKADIVPIARDLDVGGATGDAAVLDVTGLIGAGAERDARGIPVIADPSAAAGREGSRPALAALDLPVAVSASDGSGLTSRSDMTASTTMASPQGLDTDGDGVIDAIDVDDDNDGILDIDERDVAQPTGVDGYFTGAVSLSVDATYDLSTAAGADNTVTLDRPPGATVAAVYVVSFDNFNNLDAGGASDVRVDGIAVDLDQTETSVGVGATNRTNINHWGDVTDQLGDHIDAMTGSSLSLTVSEADPDRSSGVAVVVVWNDPNVTNGLVALQFASAVTSEGSNISIPVSPLNVTNPDFGIAMGLGINHSTGTSSEISSVTVNGTVVTRTAGGFDDGVFPSNSNTSGLITVGGTGDTPAPSLVNTAAGRAADREVYDISGAVSAGDTSITLSTASNHTFDFLGLIWVEAQGVEPFSTSRDTDGDGIIDQLDLDSDNDGVPDNVEAQTTTGYIAPNADTNATYATNRGLNSAYTPTFGLTPVDTDGDGTTDHIDTDSDNDGPSDAAESGIGATTIPSGPSNASTDADGDGLLDVFENGSPNDGFVPNDGIAVPQTALRDTDGDVAAGQGGLVHNVDYRDGDTDNDGVGDADDVDDDNDGILDTEEGLFSVEATNPQSSYTTSVLRVAPTTGGTSAGNFSVTDASTGSVIAFTATAPGESFTGPGRGTLRVIDIDIDTADNERLASPELTASVTGGFDDGLFIQVNGVTVVDFDYGDILANQTTFFAQFDLNGDGAWASWQNEGNPQVEIDFDAGTIAVTALSRDGTRRNILDFLPGSTPNAMPAVDLEEGVSFGIAYNNQSGPGGIGAVTVGFTSDSDASGVGVLTHRDTDGDGVFDYRDLDSDNDGISDLVESGYAGTADTNGNGTVAAPEGTIGANGLASAFGTGTTPVDTDDDDTADYLDLDSDNDGIADAIEAQPTAGYSGITSQTDTDGDGVIDQRDGAAGFGANFTAPVRSDADALADYRDTDSDGDGVLDAAESGLSGLPANVSYANADGTLAPSSLLEVNRNTPERAWRETNTPTVVDLDDLGTTAARDNTEVLSLANLTNVQVVAGNAGVIDSSSSHVRGVVIDVASASFADGASESLTVAGISLVVDPSAAAYSGGTTDYAVTVNGNDYTLRVLTNATTGQFELRLLELTGQNDGDGAIALADAESFVRSLRYSNTEGFDATLGNRTLTVQALTDQAGVAGSNVATATLSIANPAPTITLDADNSGGGADNGGREQTLVEPGVTATGPTGNNLVNLVDGDAAVMDGSGNDVVRMTINVGGVRDGGAERLNLGYNGALLIIPLDSDYTGTIDIDGVTASVAFTATTGEVVIESQDGTTPFATGSLSAFLRETRFAHVSNTPTEGVRTFDFNVTDRGGLSASSVQATVSVQATNDRPLVDLNSNVFGATSATTAVSWLHNTPVGTTEPSQIDSARVASAADEVLGAGLTGSYTATQADIAGADATDYAAARTAGDYVEYTFTTAASLDPATAITQFYNGDIGSSPGYDVTIVISDDDFATETVLAANETLVRTGGASYEGNTFGVEPYGLEASTTYSIRVYIHSVDGGPGQTVVFDDLQVQTALVDRDNAATFTEGGASVNLALPAADSFDAEDNIRTLEIAVGNVADGSAERLRATDDNGDTLDLDLSQAGSAALTFGNTTFALSHDGSTLTITDSDTANPDMPHADLDALIRALSYANTSDGPTTGSDAARTFGFTLSDSEGVSSETATATITVVPVNDAPQTDAVLADQSSVDGGAVSVATAGGFADPDGDALGYSATGLPTGLSIDSTTGVISGTLPSDASQGGTAGVYTITVTASDPDGETVSQSFNLAVANPAPTATDDAASTPEDTPLTLDALGNDTDTDGDTLAITATTQPANGTLALVGGQLRYTPNADFNGTDSFTYTVSDGEGGTDTARVTLTVSAVNDAPTATNNTNTLGEDATAAISGDMIADDDGNGVDSDVEGGLRVQSVNGLTSVSAGNGIAPSTYGSLFWNENGTYDYIVDREDPAVQALQAGETLVETFTYEVVDAGGLTDTATLTITIEGANDAPVAVGDSATTAEDMPVSIALLGNDTDAEDDTLAVSSVTQPSNGTVSVDANGVATYTPNPDFNGTDSFTYTLSDGEGGTDTATVSLTVTPVNDGPETVNPLPAQSGSDGNPISPLDTTFAFSDPDGDTLSYSATGLPDGLSIDPDTGVISGTPDSDASVGGPDGDGVYTVTVTATDTAGESTTQVVSFAFADVAPVVDTPIGPQSARDGDTLTITPDIRDPDGDALAYSATGLPDGLSIDPATGIISGTLANDASQQGGGSIKITVTADDSEGGVVTDSFVLTIANPAPEATNDSATTTEDTPVTLRLLDNDSDPDGDTLTARLVSAPANGTVMIDPATGEAVYSPGAEFNGHDSFTYQIDDGEGGVDVAEVTVQVGAVNDAPVAVNDSVATAEDTPITIPVRSNDSDVDGDPLTVSVDTPPTHGTVTVDANTGNPVYTPDTDFTGTDTFTYSVSDGLGGTDTATVTVSVDPVNDAPVATETPAPQSGLDGTSLRPLDAGSLFSDVDGDALQFTSPDLPAWMRLDADTGTLSGTPPADASQTDGGDYTVTVIATDPSGQSAQVQLAYAISNPAPTVDAQTPDRALVDGQAVSIPTAFSDPDGDTLTYSATGLPAGLAVISTTGEIVGTLDASASQVNGGVYSVTVTADDGEGGTAVQTFQLTVSNPAPTAADDTLAANENESVTANVVLGSDSDPDRDDLAVVAVNGSAANVGQVLAGSDGGTFTVLADGTLSFQANADFDGLAAGETRTTTLTYTLSDGEGGTDTATVSVVVTGTNDAPQSSGPLAAQAGTDGQALAPFDASTVFSDPDAEPLTYSLVDAPSWVSIDPATGIIGGTPPANASQGGANGDGVYAFAVAATDPGGESVTEQAVLRVANAPLTTPDVSITTPEDTAVSGALLADAVDADGDMPTVDALALPTGERLAIGAVNSLPQGDLLVNADGTYSFMPAPDFNGTLVLGYVATDGEGSSDAAAFSLTVTPETDSPRVIDPATGDVAGDPDAVLPTLNALDGLPMTAVPAAQVFAEPDGQALRFSLTEAPDWMSVDPDTGVVTGTPPADASVTGRFPVRVTATDPDGNAVSTTFDVVVANTAPDAVADGIESLEEDTSITLDLVANDTDADGDSLSVTAIDGQPAVVGTAVAVTHGTATLNADGTVTVTPTVDHVGPVVFTYTVSDGEGGSDTASVTLDVTADTTPPSPPTVNTPTPQAGGELTVSGQGEPGGTIKVTFADGSTQTVPVDETGNWTATSDTPQTSGSVSVVPCDDDGNPGAEIVLEVVDDTPPEPPTVADPLPNPDGTLTVAGQGEPGSTVSVTFPDGSTEEVPVGPDGRWIATSDTPQTSGAVSATQTDAAGNQSEPGSRDHVDQTAPRAPSLGAPVETPDATVAVSGTGEPGATVSVTFPDGSVVKALVGADGRWTAVSATAQPDGDITAVQSDAAGNAGEAVSASYTSTLLDRPIFDEGQPHADRDGGTGFDRSLVAGSHDSGLGRDRLGEDRLSTQHFAERRTDGSALQSPLDRERTFRGDALMVAVPGTGGAEFIGFEAVRRGHDHITEVALIASTTGERTVRSWDARSANGAALPDGVELMDDYLVVDRSLAADDVRLRIRALLDNGQSVAATVTIDLQSMQIVGEGEAALGGQLLHEQMALLIARADAQNRPLLDAAE